MAGVARTAVRQSTTRRGRRDGCTAVQRYDRLGEGRQGQNASKTVKTWQIWPGTLEVWPNSFLFTGKDVGKKLRLRGVRWSKN